MTSRTSIRSDNKLVGSPHYGTILREYNKQYQETGRVQGRKFYNEIIHPILPDYSLSAWYQFIRKFKNEAGLEVLNKFEPKELIPGDPAIEERSFKSNQEAMSSGISDALTLGATFYNALLKKYQETPDQLETWERKILADSLFKAMKAQDSRIHAIGKIKESNREEEKMDRVFNDASYG